MECREVVISAGESQHRGPAHLLSDRNLHRSQVRVRRPETTAVGDRDGQDAGNAAGEGDPSVFCSVERHFNRRRNIDAPMPAVPAHGSEAAYDISGKRGNQPRTRAHGDQERGYYRDCCCDQPDGVTLPATGRT